MNSLTKFIRLRRVAKLEPGGQYPSLARIGYSDLLLAVALLLCVAAGTWMRLESFQSAVAQPRGLECCSDAYARYHVTATNLAAGHGFSSSPGPPYTPNTFDVPGYVGFLWVFYRIVTEPYVAVVVAQHVLEALTWLVCGLAGWFLRWPRGTVTAAACMYAICPFVAWYAGDLMTEVAATFLTAVAMIAALHAARAGSIASWALFGAASGTSLLVRPDLVVTMGAMLIAVALVGLSGGAVVRALLVRCGAAVVVCATVLVPWGVRSEMLTGEFRPLGRLSDQVGFGYVAWLDTWVDSPRYIATHWWPVNTERWVMPEFPENSTPTVQEKRLLAQAKQASAPAGPFASQANVAFEHLAGLARAERPLQSNVLAPLRRVVLTWAYVPVSAQADTRRTALAALWLFLGVLAVCGTVAGLVQRQWLILIPIAAVAGRLALPYATALGAESRYLLESVPAICLLAAFGGSQILGRRAPALIPWGFRHG